MTISLAPHPLLIPPDLAKEIGLHQAVILQQIHYWLEKSNHLINGCRWIYNTYQACLSSLSSETTAFTTSKTISPYSHQREEEEKRSDKIVIAQSCTSPVASGESVSDEQTDFDEDICSAPGDHSQKDFDSLPCSENKEQKSTSSISIQRQEGSKTSPPQHNGTIPPATKVVFASSGREELLNRLSVLANESVDNLRHNTSLASALERYPERVDDALEFFQQAISTWKNKPGIGLFIHAVKTGQKPSLTKPGCGWKEWADEATKRQLMEYSHSHDGDIMVHFVGGVSKLWSQLRGLSWVEVECVPRGGNV